MYDKREAYRNIMAAWYIMAGIDPFKPFCEEQIKKLIKDNPADEQIIREEYERMNNESL